MRSAVKYLLIFTMLILFSCDKSIFLVNCSGCTKDEPKSADISISLNVPGEDLTQTVINVYSGNLEDNILLTTFYASGSDAIYTATLNKKYSFTATYYINSSSYIVVDAIFPRSKYESNACKEPCYYTYDTKVNLKLKYTK
jgi:hypothetical protein